MLKFKKYKYEDLSIAENNTLVMDCFMLIFSKLFGHRLCKCPRKD